MALFWFGLLMSAPQFRLISLYFYAYNLYYCAVFFLMLCKYILDKYMNITINTNGVNFSSKALTIMKEYIKVNLGYWTHFIFSFDELTIIIIRLFWKCDISIWLFNIGWQQFKIYKILKSIYQNYIVCTSKLTFITKLYIVSRFF